MNLQKEFYLQTLKVARAGRAMLPVVLMLTPAISQATGASSGHKLSTLGTGWELEAKALVPVICLVIAGIGVCIGGTAIISGIMAKKQNRPLEWQLQGVIGGALAVILPLIILAFAGSIGNGQGDADTMVTNLNLKY